MSPRSGSRSRIRLTPNPVRWTLPGSGEALEDCGKPVYVGCLNVAGHPGGKAYIAMRKHSCGRRECPMHYGDWARKEGRTAARRIWRGIVRSGFGVGLPVHFVLSPPQAIVFGDRRSFAALKNRAYRLAQLAGYPGGELVFHPWRCKGGTNDGPHFHGVGPGWNEGTAQIFANTGWVIKRAEGEHDPVLRSEEDVQRVIAYCLTHCGIGVDSVTGRSLQALTWYGTFSYSKLKLPKEVDLFEVDDLCPHCQTALVPVDWFGDVADPPPNGLVDADLVSWSFGERWLGFVHRDRDRRRIASWEVVGWEGHESS